MPSRHADGTYRVRRLTPGYRSGRLVIRLGIRDKRTAQRWEQLTLDAYREGLYDILDALVGRQIWFPEAIHLRGQGGWAAVREAIAAKRSANGAGQYDAEELLNRYIEVNPKGVRPKTLRTIESHVSAFIMWLKRRHNVELVDPAHLFTRENLRSYRDALIASRHATTAARLRAAWDAQGDTAPTDVERDQILDRDRGAKRATANRHVNSIGAFATWLVAEGVLESSPAVGVRLTTRAENPYRERTYRYFTPSRLQTFFTYSKRYDEANSAPLGKAAPDTLFWRFLVATGATTQNEATRFRVRHLALDRESEGMVPVYIHGTKTAYRPREVEIPVALAADLVARAEELAMGDDAPLFPFSHDEYLAVWRGVLRLIEAEKPAEWQRLVAHRPYDLRHTFAVNALRSGLDLEQLRQLMGHSSITTTQMYARHQQSPRQALKRMASRLGLD